MDGWIDGQAAEWFFSVATAGPICHRPLRTVRAMDDGWLDLMGIAEWLFRSYSKAIWSGLTLKRYLQEG